MPAVVDAESASRGAAAAESASRGRSTRSRDQDRRCLSEPLHAIAQRELVAAPRAVAEPAAAAARGVVAAYLLTRCPNLEAAALGWAQVAAAVATGLARWLAWRLCDRAANLGPTADGLDEHLSKAALALTAQAAVKHGATEADRVAVAVAAPRGTPDRPAGRVRPLEWFAP